MQFFESSLLADNNPEDEDFRFDKSLRELKDLRSQLHYAADYCQSTYLNAPDKKVVLENTKEYVCRAVVTLVDHLGNVSANLDSCISKTREISDAELRLDCMLQRLLSCEKYAHKLALTHLRWNVKMPRHHPRYISTSMPTAEGMVKVGSSASKPTNLEDQLFETDKKDQLSVSAETKVSRPDTHDKDDIANFTRGSAVLPVRDGYSILPKGPNPTFHFQLCSRKSGRRQSLQVADTNWLQGTHISGYRGLLQGAESNLSQSIPISGRRHSLQGFDTKWLQSIQKSGRRRSLQGADIISLFWKGKG